MRKGGPIMENVHIFDHPLIHHKISYLRDARTSTADFRAIVEELAMLMAFEVLSDLETYDVDVQTPLATAHCRRVDDERIVIVPILRAGLGMVPGFQKLLPFVRVGHIGLERDETTHEPHAYYYKMPPESEDAQIIVVDPMLATGGSACDAIAHLKANGMTRIKFVCLIASEQGLARLHSAHPDVAIYAGECDPMLNDDAYIVPGLGDAGDRIFGTISSK